MQNKGFVRVFAILLTLVCVFYLSFSFVTRHYTSKAKPNLISIARHWYSDQDQKYKAPFSS